jgi:AraC family transcriptional regulator
MEPPLEAARDWVQRLGGRGTAPVSFAATRHLAVGRFRFDGLADEVEAPALPFHYVSVSLGGPLRIEARLDGARLAARIRPGQSVIMAAGRSNSWRWDGPTEEAHVFVKPQLLEEVAAESGRGEIDLEDRIAVRDPALGPTILALAEEIARPGGSSSLFIDTAAQSVALGLLRRHCGGAEPGASGGRGGALSARQLRRVVAIVEDRLSENIRLDDLADAAGASRFHFVRAFRAAVGDSPHRWLTARRIDRAKRLLAETGMPMIDIAAEVGFESQSHFGSMFRAMTGCSPSDWRRARRT